MNEREDETEKQFEGMSFYDAAWDFFNVQGPQRGIASRYLETESELRPHLRDRRVEFCYEVVEEDRGFYVPIGHAGDTVTMSLRINGGANSPNRIGLIINGMTCAFINPDGSYFRLNNQEDSGSRELARLALKHFETVISDGRELRNTAQIK